MPKSKKKRNKKYRPKPISIGYSMKDIEHMKSIWNDVALKMFVSLPAGTAVEDDLRCVRDLYNVCIVDIVIRKDLKEEMAKAAWDLIHKAGEATEKIFYRGVEKKHFVATGDEIQLIYEATKVCIDFVQECLENCPGIFMQEWATAKVLSKDNRPMANKTVSASLIRRTFYSMTPEKYKAIMESI